MHRNVHTAFLGTARSGLGHLRRLATIAGKLTDKSPETRVSLVTNAPPEGLSRQDLASFEDVQIMERQDMAEHLARSNYDLAVLDTLQLPGIENYTGRAVLILRETPGTALPGFRRAVGRPWDRVIVPNPAAHWQPEVGADFARSVDAVGWIVRPTGCRGASRSAGVIVATGGGGTAETRRLLYPLLDALIAETRRRATHRFRVRQALGPRAGGESLDGADELFDPGADLNDVFRRADVVISTAGYNSVLELASTDTPALLTAIPRSLDDQAARVALWGPRMGLGLDPDHLDEAAAWLVDQIDIPRRRPQFDLGQDGADKAADLLLDLLCPVS